MLIFLLREVETIKKCISKEIIGYCGAFQLQPFAVSISALYDCTPFTNTTWGIEAQIDILMYMQII